MKKQKSKPVVSEFVSAQTKTNTQKGITLVALIITIIVLLILTTVTIKFVIMDGIIANAKKAAFYAEMGALEEQKNMSKISNFMLQGDSNNVEASFLSKNVTVEELNGFSDTLKAEIAFARSGFGGGMQIKTQKIWKDNLYDSQALYQEEFIAGVAENIFYISKEASGKEEKYIYDQTSDMCYKIEDTKIGKYIVHSLAYAQLVLDGKNSNGIGVLDTETKIMVSSDGTMCYEPDLNNFSFNTEVIYYSPDMQTEYAVPAKQFIEDGKKATIDVNGQKYTFANYSSTNEKVWANIKCNANNIESYWTWMPRFAYKLDSTNKTSDIIFVNTEDKQMDGTDLPDGYAVHEAFKQQDGLKGIWFSKYQPTALESLSVDNIEPEIPDLSNFNAEGTKLIYYTADAKESIEVNYSLNPNQTIEKDGKMYYFYNYTNKIWANIKCTSNNLESWWVWIPRFAYKIESGTAKAILVDENNIPLDTTSYGTSLPSGYKLHEAFNQDDGLKGIWFSKYQPSK